MCVTEQFLYACPDVPCIHKQTQFLGPEFWSFLKKEISLLSRHGLTPIYLAEGPCFPIESFQSTGHFLFRDLCCLCSHDIFDQNANICKLGI